ncbi:MAG: glycosyltransferase, partial [Pseudomonadales bacterium]
MESLLEKTAYTNYELLIVDNNSETAEALAWFAGVEAMADDKVRILRYPQPFNYSAINNMAAREARGEYLVLLNNDTAIISERWLDELLNHALRPEVGIVGAKLLYPDGRIQHAGVVLGLRGPADHPFIGEPMEAPGYMQRLQVDQNYSAVTAACLMIRKSIYEDVGGLEEGFQVSYNDVDLCLKVREAGHLIVWTPHAVVMHEGSVSQKRIDPKAVESKRQRFIGEQDAMYEKWLPALARDPAYNRNLSLNGKGFELETDVNLTWRPLTWRPLPVVLAHPADPWGCGNYRVIRPLRAMRRDGLVDGMLSEGLLQVVDLERYDPDIIVLQRQIGDERLEAMRRIQRFSRAFTVYELDDYLPNLPMKNMHREHMPKDILKSLRKGLNFVDRFVVSTEPLAEALAGLHGDIRVIENRLPVEWWKDLSSQRRRGRKPRVGWAGGVSHTGDLELIADVVKELAAEVEWVFFGMCPEAIRPYVHEVHEGVQIDLYPAALARLDLDLALAPIEQNLFNECKSNLR